MTGICNIASALPRLAAESPDRIAMRCPGRNGRYDTCLTYGALDARSDAIAAGLARRGIVRGTRTVLMVRPTPDFFLLMFALFKAGAVPVLVDPGIDKRALKQCLDEAQAEAFIGIPLAHFARVLLGWAKSARMRITTGRVALLADATLAQVERDGAGAGPQLSDTQPDDVAALLFTSGSTGVPKGVVYRHRHFVAQIDMLRDAFGIAAGGIDFPTFPPFALFDPALGLTSIIPDMDPTRPAKADARRLHAAIARFDVDQLFGSPALMRVLAEHGAPLPTLKRVTSAGAPVPPDVVAKMLELLPDDACFWTPYGATECLPVAVIEGRELLQLRERTEQGAGTCVGRPVPPNDVRIIRITDDAIAQWSDDLLVEPGVVGEITVAGPSATDAYFNRDAQTRLAKIVEALAPTPALPRERGREQVADTDRLQHFRAPAQEGHRLEPPPPLAGGEDGLVARHGRAGDPNDRRAAPGRMGWGGGQPQARTVHRMGDVGWFDAEGRLWFCGRKSHRVETAEGPLYTEQVEPVFNTHPGVRRTALVGIGAPGTQQPVLCVEAREGIGRTEHPRIASELRALGARLPHTARIATVLFHPGFPVDIRHNAKIGRETLAAWASTQLEKKA
ncbi:fatty acid CoA ligase family protein [Luteimonas aestuarii]|uniref:fatty acid CoA ligase family protein n=1 Tax=Luteimonas aestuarii TaxID=453837 RepID=UPI001FB764CE|nr:fatty acid CoA ligase family protein [Luteimonas aestuarii]